MQLKEFITNAYVVAARLLRYNMKIIFANKFIYFLMGAVFIFISVAAINVFYLKSSPNEESIYWILLLPGILIIFYPITFGIQNDSDNRVLELVFGIPNYRYKVQFLRISLIFFVSFAALFVFILLSYFILTPVAVFEMLYQIMFPILFIGSTAFLITTFVRDGSGTAVIMIIIAVVFMMAGDFFVDNPKWNIFLNPFSIPDNLNETVWTEIVMHNRLYLFAASIFTLLYGLLNLQKRERLLK